MKNPIYGLEGEWSAERLNAFIKSQLVAARLSIECQKNITQLEGLVDKAALAKIHRFCPFGEHDRILYHFYRNLLDLFDQFFNASQGEGPASARAMSLVQEILTWGDVLEEQDRELSALLPGDSLPQQQRLNMESIRLTLFGGIFGLARRSIEQIEAIIANHTACKKKQALSEQTENMVITALVQYLLNITELPRFFCNDLTLEDSKRFNSALDKVRQIKVLHTANLSTAGELIKLLTVIKQLNLGIYVVKSNDKDFKFKTRVFRGDQLVREEEALKKELQKNHELYEKKRARVVRKKTPVTGIEDDPETISEDSVVVVISPFTALQNKVNELRQAKQYLQAISELLSFIHHTDDGVIQGFCYVTMADLKFMSVQTEIAEQPKLLAGLRVILRDFETALRAFNRQQFYPLKHNIDTMFNLMKDFDRNARKLNRQITDLLNWQSSALTRLSSSASASRIKYKEDIEANIELLLQSLNSLQRSQMLNEEGFDLIGKIMNKTI